MVLVSPRAHLRATRFRIVSLLGRGGSGEVYRAEDLRLGQSVAVKLLSAAESDETSVQRFTSEVPSWHAASSTRMCAACSTLARPRGGITSRWNTSTVRRSPRFVQRIGRLPAEKALDVARQLCVGLDAAHAHGVLHRDLKPSNIMLDGRGRVRIMDFGVATRVGEHVGEIAGTPAYMAPEQLTGAATAERSDIFALGLVLYEIFTGSPVFEAHTYGERVRVQFDPHRLALPGIDPAAASIVRACLALDAADRPANAAEVAARLPRRRCDQRRACGRPGIATRSRCIRRFERADDPATGLAATGSDLRRSRHEPWRGVLVIRPPLVVS